MSAQFFKKIVYCLTIFLIAQASLLQAQSDSLDLSQQYEQISLDGKLAYLNSETDTVITAEAYAALFGLDSIVYNAPLDESHWDTLKVNPFKGLKIDYPFEVQFDQDTFVSPILGKKVVTSRFGRRRRGPHKGIDIDLVTGDSVLSMLPGKVRFVGYSSGHGRTVIVRHANNIETLYAHLSFYEVKVNDWVEAGTLLGLGGRTGNARGSHLHLEVKYKGICIHPEYIFDFKSNRLRNDTLWVTESWVKPRYHSSYRKSTITSLTSKDEALAFIASEPRFHIVRSGDTLSGIGRRYGLYVSELCKMNRISKRSILKIGQRIKVR